MCTLGPSTSTATAIEALVDAGMDVARLNFSHGTQVEHGARIALVRAASDATQRAVGVLPTSRARASGSAPSPADP